MYYRLHPPPPTKYWGCMPPELPKKVCFTVCRLSIQLMLLQLPKPIHLPPPLIFECGCLDLNDSPNSRGVKLWPAREAINSAEHSCQQKLFSQCGSCLSILTRILYVQVYTGSFVRLACFNYSGHGVAHFACSHDSVICAARGCTYMYSTYFPSYG